MATQAAAAAAAAAAANNSNNQSGSPLMMLSMVDVEDEKVLERLRWIKYPVESRPLQLQQQLTNDNASKKRDLYWPTLLYKSHREAADLGNHQNFQHMLAEPLLEMLLADSDDDDDDADPGPVCRLLGFQDGTYMTLPKVKDTANDDSSSNNKTVPFVANMAKCFVQKTKKEKYFCMDLPEECELYDLYQAAVLEAKALLKDGNKSKRRLVGNSIDASTGHDNNNNHKKFKPSSDHENNGGGSHDGGEDKPDAATRVTFQNVRPALAPLQQQQQAEALQQVAASTTTPSTPASSSTGKKKKKKEPPATPPFQARSDIHNVSAGEPWKNIWFKMRCSGWTRRNARINENGDEKLIWTKPGCDPIQGVEGVDYFTSELGCQGYVHSKIPHWRPPAWDNHGAVEGPPILAPAPPNQHRRNHNNNRRGGSSATVITTDSSPGRSQPPPPARSVRRRAASQQASKYTAQTSLVAYKVKEQLWWRKSKVPTLSQVKPILHKLGIRRNESGSYVLPDAVTSGNSTSSSPPDLTDADMLRKYLCTKGVPAVPADKDDDEECQLTEQEQDVLHQWVSFAYVPVQDLEESLTTITLPPQQKILHLLAKFKFQMSDEKYFVPLVDQSGARGDARVEGLHFFRGLSQVRDYIRRAASLSWTKDDFDESDNSEDGMDEDDFPQEMALLRLWAASSPSPLPAYETSLAHLEKMESMLPQEDNEFESEVEDDDVDDDDDDSMSVSSEEASEEEEDAESIEEEQNIESEEESVQSGSTGRSDNSSAEGGATRHSMAGKRKAESTKHGKKTSTKKQKNLPWWQTESFPSEDTMKPILSKLGIFKQSKAFIIPGKDTEASLKTLESVRKFLCFHGIPVHGINKPSLNANEKEFLRRWVSFAHVPVTQKQCLKKITSILPLYEKHFAQGSETQFFDILSKVRFQKDSNGKGYYPPGIDSLGRDKETRMANLKEDIPQVREYIRCSERLTLDDKDGEIVEDSELRIDSDRLLALRLWGALEPSTLRSYIVDPSHAVAIAPAPTAKERRKMKNSIVVQELESLEYPVWWKETSLEDIQDEIEKLRNAKEASEKKAGSRLPRRPQENEHMMTIEQLEVAFSARMRIESKVRSSLSSKKPETIDGVIEDFIADFCEDHTLNQVEKFLAGDKKHIVRKYHHEKIESHFKDWLEYQETGVKPAKPTETEESKEQDSSPTPPPQSADVEKDAPKECAPSNNSPKDTGSETKGSLVLNLSQPSPPSGFETKDFSSPISTLKTVRASGSGNSSHTRSSLTEEGQKHLQSGARKSLVSDLEDTSTSQEASLYQSDKQVDSNYKGEKGDSASGDEDVESAKGLEVELESVSKSFAKDAAMQDGDSKDSVQQNAEDENAIAIESGEQQSIFEGDSHEDCEPHKLLLTQAEDQETPSVASLASRDQGAPTNEASDHDEDTFISYAAPGAEVNSPDNFSPVQTQHRPHAFLQLEADELNASAANPDSRRVTSEAPADLCTQPGGDGFASHYESDGESILFC